MKGLKLNDEEWITAIETPSNGSASIYQLLANRGKLFSIVAPAITEIISRSMVFVTLMR